MHRRSQVVWADVLIVVAVLVNIMMRPANNPLPLNDTAKAWIYTYGNDICWIILSLLPMVFARGAERMLSLAMLGVMLGNPIDMALFRYDEIGPNEAVGWSITIIACIAWWMKSGRPVLRIRGLYHIVIAITAANIYYRNQPDTELFFDADAAGHFMISIFAFRMLKHHNDYIATIFVALTTSWLMKELFGNPTVPYMYEYVLLGYFILRALWLWRIRNSPWPAEVRALHIVALVLHMAAVVACAWLLRVWWHASIDTVLITLLVGGAVSALLFVRPDGR